MTDIRDSRQDDLRALLDVLLGVDSALLPFASAVLEQVTRYDPSEEGRIRMVQKLASTLRLLADEDENLPPADLREDLAIVASFFQNADLLPPEGLQTQRVARYVMEAVESLGHQHP